MAATIRSRSRVLRPRVNPGDRYLSRVVKYIPTEVIMAYVASIGFVKTLAGTQQRLWSWVIAVRLADSHSFVDHARRVSGRSAYAYPPINRCHDGIRGLDVCDWWAV